MNPVSLAMAWNESNPAWVRFARWQLRAGPSRAKALQPQPRDLQCAAHRAAESKSVTVSEEEDLNESWVVVSTRAALKEFRSKYNFIF